MVQKQRLDWLDALKGVGITLVVVDHSAVFPFVNPYLTTCFMPLFFIASGYTMRLREDMVQRRAMQLLLPYVWWMLFYLLLGVIWGVFIKPGPFDVDVHLSRFIGALYSRFRFYVDADMSSPFHFPIWSHSLWFLTCLFVSILLSIPLFKVRCPYVYLIVAAYIIVSCLLIFLPVLLPWSLDTAFLGAVFIRCGFMLKITESLTCKNILLFLLLFVLYILLVVWNGTCNMSLRFYGGHGIFSVLAFFVAGIAGTISYAAFCKALVKSVLVKGLAYLGKISLTILCSHVIFLSIIHLAYQKLFQTDIKHAHVLHKLLDIAFIIAMCIITHYFIGWVKRQFMGKGHNM